MSADNGWILRLNSQKKYVLQHYFASADSYPEIDEVGAKTFDSLQDAILWFETEAGYSEYGLSVSISKVILNSSERALLDSPNKELGNET